MKHFFAMALVSMIVVSSIAIIAPQATKAEDDNYGCKCIMCLSNPGGPKEYEECRPPIDRLHRDLYLGRPFPKCDMGESSGTTVQQGYEPTMSCEEAYGEGFEKATIYRDEEFGSRQETVCRKFLGYEEKQVCDDGEYVHESSSCKTVKVSRYDTRPEKRHSEPFYVQVQTNGQKGQKFYYQKKPKKKKGLF